MQAVTQSTDHDARPEQTDRNRKRSTIVSRMLTIGVVGFGSLAIVPTASAHAGSLHAGTPHWIFLTVILIGVGIIGSCLRLGRTQWAGKPRWPINGVLAGAAITMLGTIGLTQIQIEPVGTTPTAHEWYPLLAGVAGIGGIVTALLVGMRRWPRRPRYSLLGLLLGLWVLYPVMMPDAGYRNPLGYLLVVAVPIVVGYIFWRDVSPVLSLAVLDEFARRVGGIVSALFSVFFLFSAGLFTVNPDEGVNAPTEAFVTVASFANPLVVWPAVEFYLPTVSLSGALSVGTALIIGLLAALIGINTGLMTVVWRRDIDTSSTGGAAGVVATTGATACCCCGPAVYAIASAVLGVSASPLYWAFIDPASPLGALFFVGAVVLLTGSAIRLTGSLSEASVCDIPSEEEGG